MLRRRMMMAQGGANLPAGYAKIEYLESDGNSYIDTGFKPNQDTRVVMDAKSTIIPVAGDNRCWFGARVSGTYYEMYAASSKDDIVGFIYGSGTQHKFDIDWSIRHTLEINKNIGRIDNEIVAGAVQTFSIPHNIYLCADNAAGTPKACLPMMLYSCQIYDNGTLVRDFIPAMNASGEAGLYDLKNDVWYALLPVAKPKVENKIIIIREKNLFGDITIFAVSEFLVSSLITVTLRMRYTIILGGDICPIDFAVNLTIPKNMNGSDSYTISSEAKYPNYNIESISPTEDDTYIYTF